VNQGELGIPDWLPSGRRTPQVPTAAREVITAARSAGWFSLAYWTETTDGVPLLIIRVARPTPRRHFELAWHSPETMPACPATQRLSRDVSAVRLSLARVRGRKRGQWKPVPNVDSVLGVIAAKQVLHVVADGPEGPSPERE